MKKFYIDPSLIASTSLGCEFTTSELLISRKLSAFLVDLSDPESREKPKLKGWKKGYVSSS